MDSRKSPMFGAGTSILGGAAGGLSYEGALRDAVAREDLARRREAGRATGAEARAVGIHLTLGPVLDVNSNPDNPIINVRSFGEHPRATMIFGQTLDHVGERHDSGRGDDAGLPHRSAEDLPRCLCPFDEFSATGDD